MRVLRKYISDSDYIKHQLEKTTNKKVYSGHMKNRKERIEEFERKFDLFHTLSKNAKILCIGSRYGEEVEAFQNKGWKRTTGIDLIDYPPFTKRMDMHNLKFKDNTFDVVYTNSLDHSINLKQAIREIIRVSKEGTGIMIELELFNNHGDYETIEFTSVNDIKDIIDSLGIKYVYHDILFGENLINKSTIIDLKKHTLLFQILKKNV